MCTRTFVGRRLYSSCSLNADCLFPPSTPTFCSFFFLLGFAPDLTTAWWAMVSLLVALLVFISRCSVENNTRQCLEHNQGSSWNSREKPSQEHSGHRKTLRFGSSKYERSWKTPVLIKGERGRVIKLGIRNVQLSALRESNFWAATKLVVFT